MSARYRGSSWSFRIAGMLVVVALALLSGAVIGSVGVYIVSDALAPPPMVRATGSRAPAATNRAGTTSTQTARGSTAAMVDPAFRPAPAESRKSPPPDPSATAIQPTGAQPAAAAQPQSSPAPQTAAADESQHSAEKASSDGNSANSARALTNGQVAHKAALAKKRAAVASRRRFATEAWGDRQPAAQRPVYDYYRRDDRDRANRGRQDSAQSFFGFFGHDRYNDRQDDRYDNWRRNDRD